MVDSASGPSSRGPSLNRLGATLLRLLRGHVELLGIELLEQRDHALRLALLSGFALVFALLFLLSLSLLLVLIFWDHHRLLVCALLCGVYLGAALWAALRLVAEMDRRPPPFEATMDELARSQQRLES